MPRRPRCGICTYRVGRGCDIFCGHPRGKKKPDRQVDWLTMGCEYFRAVEIGSSKGLGMATQHYRPPFVTVNKSSNLALLFRNGKGK